jgi:hypothetical protein
MTEAYPLWWPDGWPRTAPGARENDHRFHGKSYRLNMGRARDQLLAELRLLGAKGLVVSTNVELRLDGLPYSETRHIADPGVAVYFTLDGEQLVMARDQFVTVAGNLRGSTDWHILGLSPWLVTKCGGGQIFEGARLVY